MVRVTDINLLDKLYIVGPPGIGKTEIIREKSIEEAKNKNKIFIDLREASDSEINNIIANPEKYYVYYRIIATHVFPEDLGVPRERSDYIEFLPPKVLKVLSLPSIEGVLFIDELSNVQRDDQISMLYSIIQEKEASWILKLSPNIKIICAGNPSDWSEIVRALPKPLRSRLTIVRVSPPEIEEWIDYMNEKYGDNWEKRIGAYLMAYKEDFIRLPETDDENYPCPRNWTELAVLLKQFNDDDEFYEELVIGRLGVKVGSRVLSFLRTEIDVSEILEKLKTSPETFDSLRIEEKVLVINYLSQQEVGEIKQYENFFNYLLEKDREMLVLLLMLMGKEKRKRFLMEMRKILVEFAKIFGDAFGSISLEEDEKFEF